jgi:hypothetical protein
MGKGAKPVKKETGNPKVVVPPASTSTENMTPRFCLTHLEEDYGLDPMSKDQRSELILSLGIRARMTWAELLRSARHALGYEYIKRTSLIVGVPRQFDDRDKFMCFRYAGLLPMVGVRTGDTFHIIWVARDFGQIYKH